MPPPAPSVPGFDEEVAARPTARIAGGEMSLAELKARQQRIAEDFDRRVASRRSGIAA